jgi:uncharacterized membrane protein YphA (DoxX/SURF4 family)
VNNTDLALLVLRVVVGVVISMHGFLKLGWVGKGGSPKATAGWFESYLGFKPGFFWVPVAAGALAVALIGNGQYSLDAVLGLKYPETLVGLWWIAMFVGVVIVLVSRAVFAPKQAAKAA